jgi:glycosyltransferase involved in cell wall biosynthesis
MKKLTVWHLDPGAFTLFYDKPLIQALAPQMIDTKLLTTQSLYFPVVKDAAEEWFYFQWLNRSGLNVLNRWQGTRRVGRGIHYLFDQWRLTWRIAQAQPDIIHIQWALLPKIDRRFWLYWRQLGVKCVHTVHNLTPHESPPETALTYFPLYHAADALILHSEYNRQTLDEWAGRVVPSLHSALMQKVRVIPHGNLLMPPHTISQEDARRTLNLPQDTPTLLFFGIIRAYKGLPVLLEAFRLVLQKYPVAHLVIAGYLSPIYEWDEKRLRKEIARLNLINVRLDLRYIPENEVSTLFYAADLTVLPYLEVTQSGVAMVALSHGSPIIASRVGGLADVVRDGETGYLVEPQNPQHLAAAILDLLDKPELRQQMSQNARQLAQGYFGWDRIAAQTAALYRELVG